jgi:hypothetical protein
MLVDQLRQFTDQLVVSAELEFDSVLVRGDAQFVEASRCGPDDLAVYPVQGGPVPQAQGVAVLRYRLFGISSAHPSGPAIRGRG